MPDENQPQNPLEPYRKSQRLTFQVENGQVRLLSRERLNMICPPAVEQRPELGVNGGYWMELRNDQDETMFHRLLDSPFVNSAEVHSPDGEIQRVFGPPADQVFEVLVPDTEDVSAVALMGEAPNQALIAGEEGAGAKELARFELPKE